MSVTLMMLANDPDDPELEDIAKRVAAGTPSKELIFARWTTTDELRQKIEACGATHEIDRLDLVGHGSWGTFGLFPDFEVINCYNNACDLRGIGQALAPEAQIRVLACDFAATAYKAGGWTYDPTTALSWLAGVMRTAKNTQLELTAATTRLPPDLFDASGFNPPRALQLLSAQAPPQAPPVTL